MSLVPAALVTALQRGVEGFDADAFLQAQAVPPPVSVRLNPAKPSPAFEGSAAIPWSHYGRYLPSRPVFTLDPLWHAGAYYVQEASSQALDIAVRLLFPDRAGLCVLDLCAAPGGKSTLLAGLLPADATLVSNEIIPARASLLAENLIRWGAANTVCTSASAARLGAAGPLFDLVVVDAPCSGSGLFRKDPEAVRYWSPAAVDGCAARQRQILADVWPALKPGGVLLYSTCSFSVEEDEAVMAWIASDFSGESVIIPFDVEWGIMQVEAGKVHGYRFHPERVRGEGFFLGAFRKEEAQSAARARRGKSQRPLLVPAAAREAAADLLGSDFPLHATRSGAVFAAPDFTAKMYEAFADVAVRAGIPLGAPGGKEWIPAHDVALAADRSATVPAIDVDLPAALRFLKREDADLPSVVRGWHVVSYKGLGLGWAKGLGNRWNNGLPKSWRIRMALPPDES